MIYSNKKQDGFTLLETLVAFSIFAISLGVLLQIYSKGSKAAFYADQYAIATIIAQSKLANISYIDDFKTGETSGEEIGTYKWTTVVEKIDDNDSKLESNHRVAKHRVEVEVTWGNSKKTHSVNLVSMKLLPTSEI
jgi:general secretion pathway protein I